MDHADNVIDIRRPVEFSIDGRRFSTTDRRQQALDLLQLAGVDPRRHELWELRLHRPLPVRYRNDTEILIRPGARFVAIRDQADAV